MDEKKTINQLMEEAELTPGVWGRLIATGDHVWQEDINGDRAVADCDTEEIAAFVVCAPKAIVDLQQIAREAIARAETAEGENINLMLQLNAERQQREREATITPAPAGIEGVQANVDQAFHYLLNAMGIVETLDLDQIGEGCLASLAMHIATMQRLQALLRQQAEKVQP